MVELPNTFVDDLISNANTQIANFSDVLLLILGMSLALFAIGALIRFMK